MQIFSSPLTSGGGAGKTPSTHGTHAEKQIERLRNQRDSQREKLPGDSSSSPKQSNMEKTKVFLGSGGDHAVISREKAPAATTSESPAPAATAQADLGQKAVIDSINLSPVSGEVETVAADLNAGAETLRRRDEALDAELARHVKDLAQLLASPNSFNSVDRNAKSADDSGTIVEPGAPIDRQIMMPEKLRRREMVQTGENGTPAVEPDHKDDKQEKRTKGVTQTMEPKYPAPSVGKAGHVEGYL